MGKLSHTVKPGASEGVDPDRKAVHDRRMQLAQTASVQNIRREVNQSAVLANADNPWLGQGLSWQFPYTAVTSMDPASDVTLVAQTPPFYVASDTPWWSTLSDDNDATFIRANNTGQAATKAYSAVVKLETVTAPRDLDGTHQLKARLRVSDTSGFPDIAVDLYQGDPVLDTNGQPTSGTLVAGLAYTTPELTTSFAEYSYTLDSDDRALLTDYSDLYVYVHIVAPPGTPIPPWVASTLDISSVSFGIAPSVRPYSGDIPNYNATTGQMQWSDAATLAATFDHGLFTGLSDDDHTQYILADGTRAFSGDIDHGNNAITGLSALTIDDGASQAYTFGLTTPRLLLQGQTTATNAQLGLASLDNDGTDEVALNIWGLGVWGDADTERIVIGYDDSPQVVFIQSASSGTGTTRDIHFRFDATDNCIIDAGTGAWDYQNNDITGVGSLTIDDNTNQQYAFQPISPRRLLLQSQTTGTNAQLGIASLDNDGTDNTAFNAWGLGTWNDAEQERGIFGYRGSASPSYVFIQSASETGGGGATTRNIHFQFDATDNCIIDATTGAWDYQSNDVGGIGVLTTQALEAAIETITATDTLDDTNYAVMVDASGGAVTVNLPAAAANADRIYVIKKIDSSANAVTVDANGAETIDGATTAVISGQYDSITVHCDGTEWWIE